MSHTEQKIFCKSIKKRYPQFFKNINVIDVGSKDINGNNRYLFSKCHYVGIDIIPGPNVHEVGYAHEVIENVMPKISDSYVWEWRKSRIEQDHRFNTIICTEVLEHDKYCEKTLLAMYHKLKPGGLMIITAGGDGRPEHGTEANSPEASPATTDYYENVTNAFFSSILPAHAFYVYHIAQVQGDFQFYGIKKR